MMQGVLDLFGSMLPKASSQTQPPSQAQPARKRHIRLGAQIVPYAFARARRRTIGMFVGPNGLEVRAPRWVSLHEVEAALQEKADWIVRKLQESQQRQDQLHQSRIAWRDGCELPYLGQPLRVHILCADAHNTHLAQDGALHVCVPPAGHLRDAVQAWMMTQARAHFRERLDHFAPLLGVQWHTLALSSAATRWGSAGRTRDGQAVIRLNWRLMHHRPQVIDYVVVHELSHLRVMNHSPRFWETVASVMPDYAQHRRALRDEPLPPWV